MRDKQDGTYHIPIINCKHCGAENVPVSVTGPLRKEGFPDIYIWECCKCEHVPEDDSWIVGYASEDELIAIGWEKEE